mgnify:CR=1 FL=1
MRQRISEIAQAAAFLPMIGAAAVIAWQAQGGGVTAGGYLAAGALLLLAYILVELPYRLPRKKAKRKTPTCAGTQAGVSVRNKSHHENHDYYSTAI